jgi:hypothetical protein
MASIEEFFGSRAGPSDQQFHVLQRWHWMREIIHHYVILCTWQLEPLAAGNGDMIFFVQEIEQL